MKVAANPKQHQQHSRASFQTITKARPYNSYDGNMILNSLKISDRVPGWALSKTQIGIIVFVFVCLFFFGGGGVFKLLSFYPYCIPYTHFT